MSPGRPAYGAPYADRSAAAVLAPLLSPFGDYARGFPLLRSSPGGADEPLSSGRVCHRPADDVLNEELTVEWRLRSMSVVGGLVMHTPEGVRQQWIAADVLLGCTHRGSATARACGGTGSRGIRSSGRRSGDSRQGRHLSWVSGGKSLSTHLGEVRHRFSD